MTDRHRGIDETPPPLNRTQFQRVGRHDAQQPPAPEPLLDLPPLVRQVSRPGFVVFVVFGGGGVGDEIILDW